MKVEKEKILKKKVDVLELERILNIVKFCDIEKWIEIMSKRWKGRVKRRDLTSLYKWIKDGWARFDKIEERLDKLENPESDNPLFQYYEKVRKLLEQGYILCPECKKTYIPPDNNSCRCGWVR